MVYILKRMHESGFLRLCLDLWYETERNGAESNGMEQNGISISSHCLDILRWSGNFLPFPNLKNKRNGISYKNFIPILPLCMLLFYFIFSNQTK